jgi:hypothetical protein
MRRRRERLKRGAVHVQFDMTRAAVDRLVALGWLKAEARHDGRVVTEALIGFGTHALWPDHEQVTHHSQAPKVR